MTEKHQTTAVAALPLPGADALAAALREAGRRGIEKAARIVAGHIDGLARRSELVAEIRALLEDRA